jgi:hypothetical protein
MKGRDGAKKDGRVTGQANWACSSSSWPWLASFSVAATLTACFTFPALLVHFFWEPSPWVSCCLENCCSPGARFTAEILVA